MRAPARCVVVDDNPDFLTFTLHILKPLCCGAEVIGFDSAIEALDFLRTNPVQLIVTDFRMPFVNGIRLITAVRLVDRHVRIVMMSGEDLEFAAMNAGANAFILKPTLVRGLGQLLDRLGFSCHADASDAAADVHAVSEPTR
jgi:YesN/AraC family two-component response regulator